MQVAQGFCLIKWNYRNFRNADRLRRDIRHHSGIRNVDTLELLLLISAFLLRFPVGFYTSCFVSFLTLLSPRFSKICIFIILRQNTGLHFAKKLSAWLCVLFARYKTAYFRQIKNKEK